MRHERGRVPDSRDDLQLRELHPQQMMSTAYLFCVFSMNTFVQLSVQDGLEERRRDGNAANLTDTAEQLSETGTDRNGCLWSRIVRRGSSDSRKVDVRGKCASRATEQEGKRRQKTS